jgi:hypothetical protein
LNLELVAIDVEEPAERAEGEEGETTGEYPEADGAERTGWKPVGRVRLET